MAGPRRGDRLVDKVPHGHWNTTTFLAALRHDRIDAPCLFNGPINGERSWPMSNSSSPPRWSHSDIVIPDNLGKLKGAAVRRAIRKTGAKLIFSPNTRPISIRSSSTAKLKALLRKAEARTVDAICNAIGQLCKASPPRNAPTISKTQEMLQPKSNTL